MADKYISTHTGSEIDAAVDKTENLEFNPTVPSGTTLTTLNAIKSGNIYYQCPAGTEGTKLYSHLVSLVDKTEQLYVVSAKSTAYTGDVTRVLLDVMVNHKGILVGITTYNGYTFYAITSMDYMGSIVYSAGSFRTTTEISSDLVTEI